MGPIARFGIAALVCGLIATADAIGPAVPAQAQEFCDRLVEDIQDSFKTGKEITVSGVLEDVDRYDDSVFLAIGCDVFGYTDLLVDIDPRPNCATGSRVTVQGVVDEASIDIGVVLVASQLRCN